MSILSMHSKNKAFLRSGRFWLLTGSWAAVAACAAVIFLLSADNAAQSSARSDGLLAFLLDRLGVSLTSHVVRKAAHMLEYCGFALLLYNAYLQSFRSPQPVLSLLSAALYAATDEIHQYFSAGRACLLRDVFIDAAGAAVGILLAAVLYRLWLYIQKRTLKK